MSGSTTELVKVGLAVIKDRKMLLVRNGKHGEVFSTLGGKIEGTEDDMACLAREVKEEASTEVIPGSLNFLGEFRGAILGKENTFITIRLYKGELKNEPIPSSEIVEVRYFDSTIDQKHLTPASEKIFAWLKKQEYID
ncbi:MAG TPA: NUDIX domain-containing protein [Candidatus Saccharimonadales bacterium]|nr:NUDIX domain-containing protein [Candidatus Saccharimonadales bacterium]